MSKRKFSQNGMAKPNPKKIKQAGDPSNNTMTESAIKTTNSKPRVTFLTLPRELRQQILYLSCDLDISVGDKHKKYSGFWDSARDENTKKLKALVHEKTKRINTLVHALEEERTSAWASLLVGIHEVIGQDMAFVRKKWKDEIEEVLLTSKTEFGWFVFG